MEKLETIEPVKDKDSGIEPTVISTADVKDGQVGEAAVDQAADILSRQLTNRHIQLLAIGGSIGTALFVTIGNGLAAGGPASLFIAYTVYSLVMGCINNCLAEMVILHPVAGGFVRLAGQYADEALGFMVGWNFFFYEALMIRKSYESFKGPRALLTLNPKAFEIAAICLCLEFWRDDIPSAAVCCACIAIYGVLNVITVKYYGESEFWLALGKVLLVFILYLFTFITMVGGNPKHDAYGFRYWNNPGAFAPYRTSGNMGRFEGFLAALWNAAFCIVGPEYVSMAAGEARRPRAYISTAYKTIYWRLGAFFILGSLCVGVLIPWNDEKLQGVLAGTDSASGGSAAPYVMAMTNMKVQGLPHLVNALIISSIFSAGNTYTFCATRTIYSMALEGRAPHIFTKTTGKGIPIFAYLLIVAFSCLSLLQVSNSSAIVVQWFSSLISAGALIDFLVVCLTYLNFYRGCKAQGIDRRTFPYYAYLQPYCAWIGAVVTFLIIPCYGYKSFQPWDVSTFWQNYTMQIVAPVLFIFWKVVKKTKWLKPSELDLVWERPIVDEYESRFTSRPQGLWEELFHFFTFNKFARAPKEVEV